MDYMKKYESWLNNEFFDEDFHEELKGIERDEEEIKDRFYKDLEFGTAGLRGKIGAGSNRMNIYTVAQASQGFAGLIKEYGEEAEERGVVIAYDVRHMSREFAEVTAEVFAGNGINVYLYEEVQPTPVCSYTIRKLKAKAGVMVTASHNPREYNGYKAYWEEGSQILEDTADRIIEKINEVESFDKIKRMDLKKAKEAGLVKPVPEEVIEDYEADILNLSLNEEINKDLSIVYTPLNGTGYKLVPDILKKRDFKNISIVEEQFEPDADFTTVPYPNPENPEVFEISEKLGREKEAKILLATDPDADRCAMEVRDRDGSYKFFTGNMIGSLLIEYILSQRKEDNSLPEDSTLVKSIVTGDMSKAICEYYHVDMVETLTGFKNIAGVANRFDVEGKGTFIFGYEESIGYNYGSFVRDKDAVNSAMMICEMAAFYDKEGKSLIDVYEEMSERYGYYENKVVSITLEGADGQERIGRIMEEFRENPLKELSGLKLKTVIDYKNDDTGLQKANVIKYKLEDNSWYAVRPSGTEPKIKLYLNVKDSSREKALEKLNSIESKAKEKMLAVK